MKKEHLAIVPFLMACAVAFPGCPPSSPEDAEVVGAWVCRLDLTDGCMGTKDAYFMVLYADHTAILFGVNENVGEWEYMGSMLTVELPEIIPNVDLTLFGTVVNSSIPNGNLEATDGQQTDESCWNGQRVAS